LCTWETWFLTLRKEYELKLGTRFGLKRNANEEWINLHNEKFHSMHPKPNVPLVIKSIGLNRTGHEARMENTGNVFKLIITKRAYMEVTRHDRK
jgi:hypothetical protein